jgi:hypothetical protein
VRAWVFPSHAARPANRDARYEITVAATAGTQGLVMLVVVGFYENKARGELIGLASFLPTVFTPRFTEATVLEDLDER